MDTLAGAVHELALAGAILLTVLSHLLLRAGARGRPSTVAVILQMRSLAAYGLMGLVVLTMIFAMREIPLRTATAWNSVTYLLTPLAAAFVLKDPLNRRTLVGAGLIAVGIVVFSL